MASRTRATRPAGSPPRTSGTSRPSPRGPSPGGRRPRRSASRSRPAPRALPTETRTPPTSPASTPRREPLQPPVEQPPQVADNESMRRALRTILHVRRHPLGPRVYVAGLRVHECWAGLIAVVAMALLTAADRPGPHPLDAA